MFEKLDKEEILNKIDNFIDHYNSLIDAEQNQNAMKMKYWSKILRALNYIDKNKNKINERVQKDLIEILKG